MTDANYIRHAKALGKFAKLYDQATADIATLNTLLATTADQVATGTSVDNPAVLMLAGYLPSLNNSIGNGPTAIQAQAIAIAKSYLALPLFTGSMTTVPATTSAADVVAALVTELGLTTTAYFTTLTTTGIANFLNVVSGVLQTWPGSGSNQYLDSVYCVSTIV